MLTTHNYTSPTVMLMQASGLSRSRVEHCVADIDRWRTNNNLKLNDSKTELLVVSSKYRSWPMVTSIKVGVETIEHHSFCKKLGSEIWPGYSNIVWYVKPPKTILAHLRNIGNITKFLDQGSAETLVHSFVTSKIDYIIMLFCLDLYLINILQ